MAQTLDIYAPFDSGPGSSVTEDGWRTMMRPLAVPGVIRDSLNGMLVYADSTGMQVKVKTGELWGVGHYGSITSEKVVAIAAAHATLARLDRIVWRVDYVNNRIEVDAVTGTASATPAAPALTRNSSIFEGSLAVVSVPAADTGIDAAQVTDARVYGGPTVPTVADDYAVFGDKISTMPRSAVSTSDNANDGIAYVALTQAQRDATITSSRFYLAQLQVGGTIAIKIYAGYHRRSLIDVTGATSLPVTTLSGLNTVHIDATPAPITIQAGMYVAVGYLARSFSTAPKFGTGSVVVGSDLFNPGTSVSDPTGRWSTVFKGSMTVLPSEIDGHDGTWTKRDRIPWFAFG